MTTADLAREIRRIRGDLDWAAVPIAERRYAYVCLRQAIASFRGEGAWVVTELVRAALHAGHLAGMHGMIEQRRRTQAEALNAK